MHLADWKSTIVLHLPLVAGPLYPTLTCRSALESGSHTTAVDKLPSSGDQEIKLSGRCSRAYLGANNLSGVLAATEPLS